MATMPRLVGLVLALLLLSGCSVNWHVSSRSQSPAAGPQTPRETTGETRTRSTPHARLHIPPGHLPGPGECRIWLPGVPPGQQAPTGDCAELARRVPPGAWLITGRPKKSREVDVAVYDTVRNGHVLEVRIYSTKDGSFLGFR